MAENSLAATVRQGTGKGVARKLRRAGQMPGVIYGVGDPVAIQFDGHDAQVLVHHLHGSERLISLQLSDGEGKQAAERHVLLKSVQTTPVGAKLLHIDFHEVDVTKAVRVSVEVQAEGTPVGEKQGGILQQVNFDVAIECLPTIIPDVLTIDVSALDIGDSLHVSDLKMPEGVTVLTPEEETLFVVAAPRVEEEVEEAEGEEGEEGEAAEGEEAEGGEESEGEDAGEE